MRKHDVRKWLHAILDLLPVILIPVFMIYSHRHTIDSGSIQVQNTLAVDFNQQIDYVDVSFPTTEGVTITNLNNGSYQLSGISSNIVNFRFTFPLVVGHKYYLTGAPLNSSMSTFYINGTDNTSSSNTAYGTYDGVIKEIQSTTATTYVYYLRVLSGVNVNGVFWSPQVFDLTQMFGLGNEPTITEFKSIFNAQYYDYILSKKELVDYGSTIYSDTDIMSQFTYQLYNSVDKYFNMGNVFHLNEVYDWFNLNIFNGQAPIYIFIVYQIVLYELIMDLLMLLYALFMWFIDMIQKLMDKPLNSIK